MLAWLAIAACLYHIAVSGFYIAESWQIVSITLISFFALWPISGLKNRPFSTMGFWLLSFFSILLFARLRGGLL